MRVKVLRQDSLKRCPTLVGLEHLRIRPLKLSRRCTPQEDFFPSSWGQKEGESAEGGVIPCSGSDLLHNFNNRMRTYRDTFRCLLINYRYSPQGALGQCFVFARIEFSHRLFPLVSSVYLVYSPVM